MHIEHIGMSATQPNTGAAAAAIGTDSLTTRNAKGKLRAIAAWAKNQVAGFLQLATPTGHDNVRGYRVGVPIGFNIGVLPVGVEMQFQPAETISAQIAGSNTAGDVELASLLMLYDDMPGMSQRLITPQQLESRLEKLTTVDASITATAGPSYGTAEALNSDSDLLLANRDYAVLGATSRTAVHAIHMTGPDLGNARIAVPGDIANPQFTSGFFANLSKATGRGCIPVINSGNKASTLIGVSADENAGTFLTTWYLALLK